MEILRKYSAFHKNESIPGIDSLTARLFAILAAYLSVSIFLFFAFGFIKTASAASCPLAGNIIISSDCEIDGTANYSDLKINSGVTVTSPVGQKIIINATGTVTIDGTINVNGKGNDLAGQGGNGGATSVACSGVQAGGGGGGGYGATGGVGGTDAGVSGGSGGAVHGDPTNPIDLGSKGGDGGKPADGGGYGGLGGGAVIINAPEVILSGHIYANGLKGGPGGPTTDGDGDGNVCECDTDSSGSQIKRDGTGGGGGGSGGTVNINTQVLNFNGTITANGADGGDEYNSGGFDGSGGGGGGGRVFVYYTDRTGSGTMEVKGGNPGVLACGVGVPGGSGSGTTGSMVNPCMLGTLVCPDKCVDSMTKEYGGSCDINTGKCAYSGTKSCTDSDKCTVDGCFEGQCGNVSTCGGLVPCGRISNDPITPWDDTAPCDTCFTFQMIFNTISYGTRISFAVAIFMIVIAGFIYAISTGNVDRMELAKKIIFLTVKGLVIIFVAWIIVASVLALLGFINPSGGNWSTLNCALPAS